MKLKILLLAMLLCPLAVFAELPFGLSFGVPSSEARPIFEANGFDFRFSDVYPDEAFDGYVGKFLDAPCEVMIVSKGTPPVVYGYSMRYQGDEALYARLLCHLVEFLGCGTDKMKFDYLPGGVVFVSMPLSESATGDNQVCITFDRDSDAEIMIIFDEKKTN